MEEINIKTPSSESVIYCGEGAFERYAPQCAGSKFIITDSNVYAIYGKLIKDTFGGAPIHVFKAGERSKNYNTLLAILKDMINSGMTRSCTVVAVGGGVVGDVAGLAASLYMRGVNLVQIPTTLLSQVDSSVGGKTAVDLMDVKNAVGTFYQPHTVIVDPKFLNTLPAREMRCGLGEIIKYGALDAGIYNKLKKSESNLKDGRFLTDIIADCIRHKADVVCADERDVNGRRKTLNLGHTTGHAFELYYKRKSHGEFVLIGMYYELFMAEKLGVCDKAYAESLRALIRRVIKVPYYGDAGVAAAKARYDKKNAKQSEISVVVPKSEGEPTEIKLPVEQYIDFCAQCSAQLKGEKL